MNERDIATQWIALFDVLGVSHERDGDAPKIYLPTLGSRKYEPPSGAWLVVSRPNRRAANRARTTCEDLVLETGQPAILAYDLPRDFITTGDWPMEEFRSANLAHQRIHGDDDDGIVWDQPMLLIQCHTCATVRFEFAEGNYMNCAACGARADDECPTLRVAIERACRTHR